MAVLKQGSIDSLCGIYAILNAISFNVGGLTKSENEWIFSYLIDALSDINNSFTNKSSFGYLVTGGVGINTMMSLISKCVGDNAVLLSNYCGDNMRESTQLKLLNLSRRSYSRSARIQKSSLIDDFITTFSRSNGSVIIFCWVNNTSGLNHWTVSHRISDKSVFLLDSEGRERISIENIRVSNKFPDEKSPGDIIVANTVIFLE